MPVIAILRLHMVLDGTQDARIPSILDLPSLLPDTGTLFGVGTGPVANGFDVSVLLVNAADSITVTLYDGVGAVDSTTTHSLAWSSSTHLGTTDWADVTFLGEMQYVAEYTTPGDFSIPLPGFADLTKPVIIQCWGSGYGGLNNDGEPGNDGKGGGGGAYSAIDASSYVNFEHDFAGHIGTGDIVSDTYVREFGDELIVVAKKATSNVGGASADGTGTVKFSGGDGAASSGGGSVGGGGGGSAYTYADGAAGTNGNGGLGQGNGGEGGTTETDGQEGYAPGGGGGGASLNSGIGGLGATGKIIVSFRRAEAEPEEGTVTETFASGINKWWVPVQADLTQDVTVVCTGKGGKGGASTIYMSGGGGGGGSITSREIHDLLPQDGSQCYLLIQAGDKASVTYEGTVLNQAANGKDAVFHVPGAGGNADDIVGLQLHGGTGGDGIAGGGAGGGDCAFLSGSGVNGFSGTDLLGGNGNGNAGGGGDVHLLGHPGVAGGGGGGAGLAAVGSLAGGDGGPATVTVTYSVVDPFTPDYSLSFVYSGARAYIGQLYGVRLSVGGLLATDTLHAYLSYDNGSTFPVDLGSFVPPAPYGEFEQTFSIPVDAPETTAGVLAVELDSDPSTTASATFQILDVKANGSLLLVWSPFHDAANYTVYDGATLIYSGSNPSFYAEEFAVGKHNLTVAAWSASGTELANRSVTVTIAGGVETTLRLSLNAV